MVNGKDALNLVGAGALGVALLAGCGKKEKEDFPYELLRFHYVSNEFDAWNSYGLEFRNGSITFSFDPDRKNEFFKGRDIKIKIIDYSSDGDLDANWEDEIEFKDGVSKLKIVGGKCIEFNDLSEKIIYPCKNAFLKDLVGEDIAKLTTKAEILLREKIEESYETAGLFKSLFEYKEFDYERGVSRIYLSAVEKYGGITNIADKKIDPFEWDAFIKKNIPELGSFLEGYKFIHYETKNDTIFIDAEKINGKKYKMELKLNTISKGGGTTMSELDSNKDTNRQGELTYNREMRRKSKNPSQYLSHGRAETRFAA